MLVFFRQGLEIVGQFGHLVGLFKNKFSRHSKLPVDKIIHCHVKEWILISEKNKL
jgi:hypothetical protein